MLLANSRFGSMTRFESIFRILDIFNLKSRIFLYTKLRVIYHTTKYELTIHSNNIVIL